jgi:steroid delta-isomerase-like uncharacterized protein
MKTEQPRTESDEEKLIAHYVTAFNQHDIELVVACFHDDVVLVDASGTHRRGKTEIRDYYNAAFEAIPDGRCELEMVAGRAGRGVGESVFRGTLPDGKTLTTRGAEVMEFTDGKIRAIRDYHCAVE